MLCAKHKIKTGPFTYEVPPSAWCIVKMPDLCNKGIATSEDGLGLESTLRAWYEMGKNPSSSRKTFNPQYIDQSNFIWGEPAGYPVYPYQHKWIECDEDAYAQQELEFRFRTLPVTWVSGRNLGYPDEFKNDPVLEIGPFKVCDTFETMKWKIWNYLNSLALKKGLSAIPGDALSYR